MNADNMNDAPQPLDGAQSREYEAPTVVDHGSLAELTLASMGSYTDGQGFGGGSA